MIHETRSGHLPHIGGQPDLFLTQRVDEQSRRKQVTAL